jgi:hypothetical protein
MLLVQIQDATPFYPEEYNGAWVACPDPIDFRHYTVVNIYADTNAYVATSEWKRTPRPGHRDYLGHVDNCYLNNAVYEVEKFLKAAKPEADAVVDYGDRAEHCWNGDHTRSNAYSRLRYAQMALPWYVERMLKNAPADADLRSWRY